MLELLHLHITLLILHIVLHSYSRVFCLIRDNECINLQYNYTSSYILKSVIIIYIK